MLLSSLLLFKTTRIFQYVLFNIIHKKRKPIPFFIHFAIRDPSGIHNHGIITFTHVYCSIHCPLMNLSSAYRHIKNSHRIDESENELNIPPYFSKTYQLSRLLYWQICYQIPKMNKLLIKCSRIPKSLNHLPSQIQMK